MRVLKNLRKLARDPSRRVEAREYCKLHLEEILKELPNRVLMSEGPEVVDCVLNCIPTTPASFLSYKTKVLDVTLSRLRKEPAGLRLCSELVCRVCLELPRLPPADVLKIADQCMHTLVHDEDANMIWRNVLPECLSVLSEAGKIVHCGTEMSALDYKAQCVRTLCQCRCREKSVVQLAAMFREVQLDREEHAQVVTKLCNLMLDLPPETVPPLLHQLLNLCSAHNLDTVLAYLSHYFNSTLYTKLRSNLQDSDSTYMDLEDFGGHTVSELRECVSTCVYHMLGASSEQLAKVLKSWPRSQLLHNPLLLEIALALADSPAHKTLCLAVVKAAIQQCCIDEQKIGESAGLRTVIQSDVDMSRVLKVIIAESSNSCHLTTCGLINLAFNLLTTSPAIGRERLAHQSCIYAKLILVRLAKCRPENAQHILSLMADRLQENSTAQRQCADCLQVLCKLTPNSLQCAQLCTILENCQSFGEDFRSSATVFDAVHPVLNFKNRVRDTLVMVCRKGLFSRDCSSRCLALWGFLSLLRHMRIPAGASGGGSEGYSCSDQFSLNSYLTQISINLHSTQAGGSVINIKNEAVCREVISILRRCISQDAAVKHLLYTNIYYCVRHKNCLHTPILELLYEHLTRYISEEEGLALDKCVQLTSTGATLIEPIGYLLLSIQHFLLPSDNEDSEDIFEAQSDPDDDTSTKYFKNKLKAHMESLCAKYAQFQITHFNMAGEHGLADLTPECKAKSLKIQQALQVYEALISYILTQWTLESDAPANKLYGLFSVYNQLLENAKTPSKLNKKGTKTLNDTTQKTQKSQKTQKGKGKAPAKLSSMVKDRASPFKPLPCLWDLGVCCRALELLYGEEVAWSTSEQRAQLRTRRDWHQFVLGCVQSVLSTNTHMSRTALVTYCTKSATILYKRCIVRFQDMCDFNEPTALACVNTFRECLAVAFNLENHFNVDKFLQQVTGNCEDIGDARLAAILESVSLGLQQLDSELEMDTQQDAMSRRLTAELVQLAVLCLLNINCKDRQYPVISKLEQHLRRARIDCTSLIPSLLTASARFSQDGRLLDDLIIKLTPVLGKIEDEDSSMEVESEMFPVIDTTNANTAYGYACAQVIANCGHIEYALGRAKELNAAVKYVTHDSVSKMENEVLRLLTWCAVRLCLAGGRVARLAGLCCSVGAGSDRALLAAVRLYAPLTGLVNQLIKLPVAHIHTVRLERVLNACGRRLSSVLDNLISYVESTQGARSRDKVLRDTRIVPRLVFAAEQFSRSVVLLGKKSKLNLQQYISLGTARDFRIKAGVLEEALRGRETREDDVDILEPDANDDIDIAEVMSVAGSGDEEKAADSGQESEEGAESGKEVEDVRVRNKRRRQSSH